MVMLSSRFSDPISRHAQSLLDPVLAGQILQRPEDFGATPGIFPTQGKPSRLPPALTRGPTPRGGASATPTARDAGPSIADLILGQVNKLGPVGRGVSGVLSPVADFAGEVGEAGRRAARTGALAGLAPNFTQGVLAGDANRRADEQSGLNRQLIEARIGAINNPNLINPGSGNVQSTQINDKNELIIVRRDGSTTNTGIKVRSRSSIEQLGDGSIISVDPVTQERTTVLSPDEAEGIAARRSEQQAAETSAVTQAREDVGRVPELEASIEKDQAFIDQAQGFIDSLDSGSLDTGPIIGNFPALSNQGQLFEAFSGGRVLDLISEATFGALSEGEREFLRNVAFGRGKTEEANKELLQQAIDIVKGGQQRAVNERARITGEGGEVIDFNDLPL